MLGGGGGGDEEVPSMRGINQYGTQITYPCLRMVEKESFFNQELFKKKVLFGTSDLKNQV